MVPVVYSTPGVTVSTFSRWATAKMRCDGLFSAASMARNVAGRPAPIGVDTPGNNTTSRSGSTGSVSLSDMGIDLCVRVLSLHMSRAVDSIVHASSREVRADRLALAERACNLQAALDLRETPRQGDGTTLPMDGYSAASA